MNERSLLNLAWLSRHPPTNAQRQQLCAYRIRVIQPPDRFHSARDAWMLVQNKCGIPDLIFCIMPVGMLKEFLVLTAGIPVIRAVWDYSCEPPRWMGAWKRITAVQVVTEVWTPPTKSALGQAEQITNKGGQHGK